MGWNLIVPSKHVEMMPSRQLASPVSTWAAVCLVLLNASEKKLAPAYNPTENVTYLFATTSMQIIMEINCVPLSMTLLRQERLASRQPLAGRRFCKAIGCTCEMSMVCSTMPLSTAHEVMTPSREPDTSPGLEPLARLVTPPPADFACTKHHPPVLHIADHESSFIHMRYHIKGQKSPHIGGCFNGMPQPPLSFVDESDDDAARQGR